MKSLFKINDIERLFISLFTVCFIFLWGIKYNFFNFKYLFLILVFPIVFKIYLEIRNGEFKFIIHFFYISIFLFFHLFINLFLDDKSIEFNYLGGIIFFLLIFVIVYYYNEKILNNLDLIIFIFLLIFSFSVIYSLFNYKEDAPYYCGGIPNFLIEHFNIEKYSSYLYRSDYRLSFKELIFAENSHLGMIAPSIIIYLMYKLLNKKFNNFYFCLFLLFFITCFIKSSATFLAGIIASLFIISIFNFKKIPIKVLISYILLLIISTTIIVSDKDCKKRLLLKKYDTEYFKNFKISPKYDSVIRKMERAGSKYYFSSLSSEVYFRSLMIAKYSIFKRPFGLGFNRYIDAFDSYNELNPPKIDYLNYLNNKDGSNNFFKLIVEFGIFSILLFIFILKYLTSNNIKLEEKLFLMPIIITQMIRGAGYFNGGFLLIILLIVFSYIRNRKKL
jgi:hypothetical protein